jgi:hypothetical protein
MIYFYDIFEKSMSIFDDPDLSRKYYEDQAGFQSDMRDYLMVGKNKFTYPTAITDKLIVCDEAVGYMESDSGNGTDTYTLEQTVANNGEKVGFTFAVNGKPIQAQYNAEDNSVTFERNIEATETWSVSWFYAGAFSADFSDCLRSDFPMDAIMDKVVTILAYALLSTWGDKEVGRVLEVRNILTDTDFKMYSPANSARAKVEWRNQMNRDMDTLVSELNWRIMSTPKGGSRFGK